jgi:hypothetical protein
MADDATTVAPETGAPADGGTVEKVEIRDTPNADGMIPASEVAGMKSALQKLKDELKELKPKAGIVDQLLSEGISPEQIPQKLAEIKEQGKAAEQLAQAKAEWESLTRVEREKAEQAYQAQIKSLSSYLQNQTRDQALTDVYLTGGGQSQNGLDASQFKTLISQFVEWEDQPVRDDEGKVVAYQSKIKKFRAPGGDTLFVDDSKTGTVREAKLEDFLAKIKKGEYGTPLQTMLPAYNQASGSGLSMTGGVGGGNGRLMLKRSQLVEMSKLNAKELAAVKAGNYELID